jgi:chaperone modulatory protein CbpM
MTANIIDSQWLDARCEVTLTELVRLSGLSEAELRDLVDYGALVPAGFAPTEGAGMQWVFSAEYVVSIQTAQRLRRDFELDVNALSLALGLLGRIRTLEAELRALRAESPARRF